MGSIAIFRVNVDLYQKKHSGKIIGLLLASNCLGKIFFAGIMDLFFSNNLSGFFLALSLASAIVFGVCYLLLHWKLIQRKKQAENEVFLNGKLAACNGQGKEPEMTLYDLLRSGYCHMTFWPSVVFYACTFSTMNSITAIAASADMGHPLVSVYLISVVIVLTRLSFGFVFDFFSSELCGFLLLFVGYLTFAAGMLMGMVWFNAYSIYLLISCVGVGQGVGMGVYVSLFVVLYGRSNVGVLSGMFFTAVAALQQIIQLLIGYFYDVNIDNPGSSDLFCLGKDCFFWSFFFLLILTLLITPLQTLNCALVTCFQTKRKEYCNMDDALMGR